MSEEEEQIDFSVNKNNKANIIRVLQTGLNNFRNNGILCDITLKVGDETIKAHKNVLAVCSPYFMAMFTGYFAESSQQEIQLNDIDAGSLRLLIDFMYTRELNVDLTNVRDVLVTASFLEFSLAQELCCNKLLENMVLENCIENIIFAGENLITQLLEPSIEMAVSNFHSIFSKDDFLQIQFEEFKQLTKSLKASGQPDDLIFSFIMRWIKHFSEIRIQHIDDLLEDINPILVSPNILNSPEVVKPFNSKISAWTARNNVSASANDNGEHVLVSRRIGVFPPLRIRLFSDVKHRQINMPGNISDGSYACNGYYVYFQGGWKENKSLQTKSYVYNPIKCQWVPFVPLQIARAYHRSCVVDGKIYSIGGSDGTKVFSSVEFTDLYSGHRGYIASLPRAKERPGLGVHENAIYVVGGNDRGTSYNCIHRFDTRVGVWDELAPSPYRAGANSCAVVGENIYTTHPDTLQKYDIRKNEWEMVTAQYKRYPPEVFGLRDTLFGLFNDHIAKFIPDGGKWENQRVLKCNLPFLQVSSNLLFPKVNEEEISDPVFEGIINNQRNDDNSDGESAVDYEEEEDEVDEDIWLDNAVR